MKNSLILSCLLQQTTTFSLQPKCQVFTHHLIDHDYDSYSCDDSYFDIDAPVSMISAESTERNSKPSDGNGKSIVVSMPCDKWFNLDPGSI